MTAYCIEVHYDNANSHLWPSKPEQPFMFDTRGDAEAWIDEFFAELPATCIATSIVRADSPAYSDR